MMLLTKIKNKLSLYLTLSALGCITLPVLSSTIVTSNSPSLSITTNDQKIESIIPSFTARYNILRQGDVVGKATRTLTYLDGIYARYEFNSAIKWFIFSDERSETSLIRVDTNDIQPSSFSYTREGTGKDKSYQLRFDPTENKVTDLKKNKVISTDLPVGIHDQLSHHLALQQDLIKTKTPLTSATKFSYDVVKGSGRLKRYIYRFDGMEDIMLPYGLVNAVKLKQENSARTRTTYAWFAPELNYVLVKLFQTKEGVEQFETQLTSLESQPVKI